MADFTYNAGAHAINAGAKDFLTDVLKIMLVTAAYTADKDHTNVTAAAAAELTVSGYVGGFSGAGRKTLASKTVTKDNATDRDYFDAADPSAWTLAIGEEVAGAVIYFHDTDDATSVPLFYKDLRSGGTDPIPTNGGTFTVSYNAAGIAYTQQ